jgi:hypothetical protein
MFRFQEYPLKINKIPVVFTIFLDRISNRSSIMREYLFDFAPINFFMPRINIVTLNFLWKKGVMYYNKNTWSYRLTEQIFESVSSCEFLIRYYSG